MKLRDLKCISENVSLDDYYFLYDYVRDNMEHPEYLGVIPRNEVEEILKADGKIWLYYDEDTPVASVFYLRSPNKSLRKHNINSDEKVTGSLGPVMVHPDYVGNGFMSDMMKVFNEYNKKVNNKYIFTKACKDNIYSVRNILNDGYVVTHEYLTERGMDQAFLKEL